MWVGYIPSEDVVTLIAGKENAEGREALAYDQGVILGYAEEGSEEVVAVDIHWISDWLKAGYDAETDTLTLGQDPVRDFRVVECGEFVCYRHWYEYKNGDGEWEPVKLELRNASQHLAEVFAHLESSPEADPAEGDGRPPATG